MARILLILTALAAFSQTADPIPDKLRLDYLRLRVAKLTDDADVQAAMMAMNAAETRRAADAHNLAIVQSDLERRCSDVGRKFDEKQVACVPK